MILLFSSVPAGGNARAILQSAIRSPKFRQIRNRNIQADARVYGDAGRFYNCRYNYVAFTEEFHKILQFAKEKPAVSPPDW